MNPEAKSLSLALTAPFPAELVQWKPIAVKGNRALAAPYVDVRAVMQRLDEVFGVGGWQSEFRPVEGGGVLCTLHVKVGGEWVMKTDAGSPAAQSAEGDKLKSSVSDALKRAAVSCGIGRYLYRLTPQWVDYDPQTRQLKAKPQLPPWALPPAARQSA